MADKFRKTVINLLTKSTAEKKKKPKTALLWQNHKTLHLHNVMCLSRGLMSLYTAVFLFHEHVVKIMGH